MVLEHERKALEWLSSLGIEESFPYVENGVVGSVNSVEEIYFKAIFSYDTFAPIVEKKSSYSNQELINIAEIQKYQKEMGAYYAPFQVKRNAITSDVIEGYTREEVKDLLNKANRKNRGSYFVSGLQAYTSTTLFYNPEIVVSEQSKRKYKKRFCGCIADVVTKTMRLYNGKEVSFFYPYLLDRQVKRSKSIYEIFALSYQYKNRFEIIKPYEFYSIQHRKVIKKLRETKNEEKLFL